MATATVPKLVLTVNHASGAGYYAMAGQGFDPDFIFTWPTGRMGVMEGDSAVMALFSAQLEELKKQGEAAGRGFAGEDGCRARRLRAAARRPLRRRPRLRGRGDPGPEETRAVRSLTRWRCGTSLNNPGPHLGTPRDPTFVLPETSITYEPSLSPVRHVRTDGSASPRGRASGATSSTRP
jgi:3-methylcrotonyl-CoA carboxylase beta subunit